MRLKNHHASDFVFLADANECINSNRLSEVDKSFASLHVLIQSHMPGGENRQQNCQYEPGFTHCVLTWSLVHTVLT